MSGRLKEGGVRVEYLLFLKPEETAALTGGLQTDFRAPGIVPVEAGSPGATVEIWRDKEREVSIRALDAAGGSQLVRIAPVKHLNRPEQPQE